MDTRETQHLDRLFILGVSHQTAGVEQRQLYSISNDEQTALLLELKEQTDFTGFIVSTCNRTEVIGLTRNPEAVLALYIAHTRGNAQVFEDIGYQLFAEDALRHLFEVGVGMDSQIPGDFEIIMQMRKGFRRSLKMGLVTGFLEKLVNQVIHASKRVKTETAFSTGATSVSYAAVRYLKDNVENLEDKRIALYGLGKFGRITLDHLLSLTSPQNITLINRSNNKAQALSGKTGAAYLPHDRAQEAFDATDILIVATGADRPILTVNQLSNPALKVVIDLSVPCNVDPEAGSRAGLTLFNVDELSQMTAHNLNKRRGELPKAQAIVDEEISDLVDWHVMRSHSKPILSAIEELVESDPKKSILDLVVKAFPAINISEPTEEYLQAKMQRFFCHHIRLGKNIDQIQKILLQPEAVMTQQ